jgi:hypothetical protein
MGLYGLVGFFLTYISFKYHKHWYIIIIIIIIIIIVSVIGHLAVDAAH